MTVEQYPGYTRKNERPLPKSPEWRADSDFLGGGPKTAKGNAEKEQPAGNERPSNAVLESTRASNIEMAAIQWLWPDRFAIGKLGLLVGLPDEGKGQILADMAGRVTRGDEWP
jgi:hypothetical protein